MKNLTKILIVEDDTLISLDIQNTLKFLGFGVAGTAVTGIEAIEAAKKLNPDLILMDIRLKGEMDGIEAAGIIKEQQDIPVVYLTAYTDDTTLERAKKTSPLGYLLKPFEDRELNTILQMALYKHDLDRKLQENERWLSTTLKSIGDGVIATDPKGKIKFMNAAAEELTGWSEGESVGKELTDVFNIYNEEEMDRAVENPVSKVIKNGLTVGLANHTILKDRMGRERYIMDTASPILSDEGEISGIVLVFQDVTDKKLAEIALREQEESYRCLIESSIDPIYVRQGHRFLMVNKAWENMFGYKKEEVLNGSFDILDIIADESKEFIANKYQTLKYNQAYSSRYEFLAVSKDGEKIHLEASVSSIKWKGVPAYQGICRDITLKKLEEERLKYAMLQAEKSNNLKNEFLAQMSHEIRTPLNNILTFTSLLKEELGDRLPLGLESTFSIVSSSAQRLIRTIESILNLSRISSGNYEASYEVIDLNKDVIEEITLEFYLRAKEKGIEISYRNFAEENVLVNADRFSLSQIFINLIDNAVKYTSGGFIDIKLCRDNEDIVVEISDSGIGISEEFLPDIFTPFAQEDSGFTRPFEGTGLGLALVKKYTEINNCRIVVESKKNSGTKFKLYFKVHRE